MNLDVRLRTEAIKDIEAASAWYERQTSGLGGEFLDEVLSVCSNISKHPKLYPVVHRSTRRAVLRRFPFGIFFQIEEEYIIVLGVMHGSRHPKRWQNRR